MQHQVEHILPETLAFEYCHIIGTGVDINPGNDCGRGTTVHSHHRVGYDGQDEVLSTEHALFVLSPLLFISSNSNQNAFTNSKAQSCIHWNDRCLQEDLQS